MAFMPRVFRLLCALVLVAPFVHPQAPESRGLKPHEAAYARGDFKETLRLALEEMQALSDAKLTADPAVAADAEILLLRIHALVSYDPAGTLAAIKGPRLGGWLGVRRLLTAMEASADLGLSSSIPVVDNLGFIDRFLIVAPFPNERGAGQSGKLAPEEGPVDPDATLEGKDRQVRWRGLSGLPTSFVLDLADLVVPKEQCIAYLAAVITSDADRVVQLGIGHSSFCRVSIDGMVVYEKAVQRDDAVPDQEHVPVRLRAGKNELLIKCGVVTGPFKIAVRIADADGGLIPAGVAITASPDAFPRRRPEAAPDSRPIEGVADARKDLEARAKKDDAAPEDLVRWARLRLLLKLDDRAHPETPALTKRAVASAGGDLRVRDAHARALRRHTDIAAEREDNARVAALQAVLQVAPDHVPTLVELGRTYFEELRHVEVAISFLDRALAANPKAPEALARLAQVRSSLNQDGRAESLLRQAAEARGSIEGVGLASWLMGKKRYAEAREALDRAAKIAPASALVLRTAGLLAEEASNEAGASEAARALLRRNPTDDAARMRLAALLDAHDDPAASYSELEELLRLNPDIVDARRRAAILADRLGRREAALDHLAHALVIEPGNARIRRLEGWLSGHEKSFEEAFPVDAAALVKAAPDWKANPGNESHRYLLMRTIIRVNQDGTSGTYRHFLAQILNQRGADEMKRVFASYDWREQRARFKVARLFRGDAEPVEADRPHPSIAEFPSLRAGDVVEWAYRVDDLRQSYFGNYFGARHAFQMHDLAAVLRSELILLLPKSRTFTFHARNATLEAEAVDVPPYLSEYEGRRYAMGPIEHVASERAMPDASEFVPTLEVSTYQTWDQFASWWWNLIRQQYDVSDGMKAKLAELLKGKTTREEKIRAIYDFVVTDIRYVAWEFGVHGYKPYRASAIFERRFGDCKDKALVMNAMLKEAGIDGYPVLIRLEEPRSAEDHELPLVQHFNHCIAAIPEEDGTIRFLDGTAEYHSASDLPDGDRGAAVVVVRDGKAIKTRIPVGTPEQNQEREDLQVTMQDDGRGTVVYRAEMSGQHAVATRSRYVNEADRKQELTSVVNRRFGQGTLQAIEFSPLSDLSKPVTMGYTFEVGDLLLRDGARARVRPLWSEFDWTSLSVNEKRRFDILVGSPSRTVTTAAVTLPKGWRVAAMPEDTRVEAPFARYELTRRVDGDVVRFERTLTILEPRIPAADYQVFRRFVTGVAEADRETVTLEAAK
jgi:tetratricopeptide (TPR) repeat protein